VKQPSKFRGCEVEEHCDGVGNEADGLGDGENNDGNCVRLAVLISENTWSEHQLLEVIKIRASLRATRRLQGAFPSCRDHHLTLSES